MLRPPNGASRLSIKRGVWNPVLLPAPILDDLGTSVSPGNALGDGTQFRFYAERSYPTQELL